MAERGRDLPAGAALATAVALVGLWSGFLVGRTIILVGYCLYLGDFLVFFVIYKTFWTLFFVGEGHKGLLALCLVQCCKM